MNDFVFKAYQDRLTGKWKWGKRGEAIYSSKGEAEKAGMDILIKRLREVRDSLDRTIAGHGVN